MEYNSKITIEDLNESFSDEYIYNVGVLVHKMAKTFFDKNNLKDIVYFDDNIFQKCLLDLLVDLARLKHYHNIELVNYIKLTSYVASWVLKRKPFQLIESAEPENIFVNEQFALSVLLQGTGICDNNRRIDASKEELLIKNVEFLLHHLKYRNTNPQTLELMLVGIDSGMLISTNE